jgi:hypothetical protein
VDRRYKQRAPRSKREVLREDRELVRVEVSPFRQEPSVQFQKRVKIRVSVLKPARKRLIKADLVVSLFHEPTLRSVEFWTAGPKEEAVARGMLILNACVEAGAEPSSGDSIIRQYDVGLGPKIKDTRTGRVTTRVNQVMKGNLDGLL